MGGDQKSFYEQKDLLRCAQGELFGPGNAQLPAPPLLMIERITHISTTGGAFGNGEATAEMPITPDHWFFACHFPGDPIMPGCLGLDGLWQLLGFFLAWAGHKGKGRALGVGNVKFAAMVKPNAGRLLYHLDIKKVVKRGLCLVIANGHLSTKDTRITTAEGLRLGLFEEKV